MPTTGDKGEAIVTLTFVPPLHPKEALNKSARVELVETRTDLIPDKPAGWPLPFGGLRSNGQLNQSFPGVLFRPIKMLKRAGYGAQYVTCTGTQSRKKSRLAEALFERTRTRKLASLKSTAVQVRPQVSEALPRTTVCSVLVS
jgi:hypothetical protein